MDLRGQDHKRIVLPSSFIYNPPIREPTNKVPSIFSTTAGGGGGDRRRDVVGQGNGNSILSSSQAFDQHHHQQHHHQHTHHHHQQQQLHHHHQQQQQQSPPTPTPAPPPSLPLPLQQQHQQQQQQQQQQQARALTPPPPPPPAQQHNNQGRVPDPDPESDSDPVPVSIAATPVTSLPIGGGGSTTPNTRNEVFSVRYRECLKNHAASIGGHVVDGCGEFMPGGEEGTPESLRCAACECHRNFHRKESDGEPQSGANYYYCYNPNSKANGSRSRPLRPSLPAPPLPQPLQQHQKHPIGGHPSPPSGTMPSMMMTFGGGGSAATDSSSEEMNMFGTNAGGAGSLPQPPQYGSSLSKKRFRTKFSKEQKDKMMEFAEKVGWRMQKQDEPAIQHFCSEVGVKRQVLKVWMHNNKHSIKKKDEL